MSLEIVNQLDYVDLLGAFSEEHIFNKLHTSSWDILLRFQFILIYIKYTTPFRNISLTPLFDLIFYDAFGFRGSTQLWQKDIFEKMVKILNRGGVLVTYCARGSQTHFEIFRITGRISSWTTWQKRNDTSDPFVKSI